VLALLVGHPGALIQASLVAPGLADCDVVVAHTRAVLAAVLSGRSVQLLLSFTSWLVVGVNRQSHRSAIVDPLNVTPRTTFFGILYVVNAKCDTRSAIVVSFRPPRDANAMDPHNQPKRNRQYLLPCQSSLLSTCIRGKCNCTPSHLL
jgi:hypothetical protein